MCIRDSLRIAQVYDIPIANNKATADFMITSSLMDQEYEHDIINFCLLYTSFHDAKVDQAYYGWAQSIQYNEDLEKSFIIQIN